MAGSSCRIAPASTRYTNSTQIGKINRPVLPLVDSCSDRSVHSNVKPLGNIWSARFFMMPSAVAELVPGAVSPWSSAAG